MGSDRRFEYCEDGGRRPEINRGAIAFSCLHHSRPLAHRLYLSHLSSVAIMTTQQIEEVTRPLENRIEVLEAELAQIKQMIAPPKNHWWDTVFGSFADCPEFDEMEKAGQAWRAAQNQAPDLE
jgi:hypothetical protein